MQNERKIYIENILKEAKKLSPSGKDFIAGYIFGKEQEREEQEKKRAIEQTA